jgi:Zn-dependent M28 family amino/carboxypeptidase
MTGMPGKSYTGPQLPLSSMERDIRDRLQRHVSELAGRIGERNVWHENSMQDAASYIRQSLEETGYAVNSQSFPSHRLTLENIEAVLPGDSLSDEIVITGAHYDTVAGSPGANDNASGVAALLVLAQQLASSQPARSVHFVAFANEEAPFFYSDEMGSLQYANRARQHNARIVAMISLETIGSYYGKPGSQRYPQPFSLLYPDTGNFIGFVGNLSSRTLVRRALRVFRDTTPFPSEGVAAPSGIEGIHWSDHWSFWEMGYPAIMVTDTALFRYPHYHTAADIPEQLDYTGMARVVNGLGRVVADLAGVAADTHR